MNKEEKILYIKNIVKDFGTFTTADVEAESSPCINSMGKDAHQLLETFYEHKAEAISYIHDSEVGTDYLTYEDLREETIEEILILAQSWEAISLGSIGGE
jgi:hypothetical protein